MKTIIFTDLDGTLLHPKTYSFEAARPALDKVRERDIPLVFVSSKTRAELEVWRRRLDNHHPFITENGGGIFIPEDYFAFPVEEEMRNGYTVVSLGAPYAEIRRRFAEMRERLSIAVQGFGDMTVDEIAALVGLSHEDAVLAKEREFGEPFFFEGEVDGRFFKAIEAQGLCWTQGRFFHLMGDNDKGKAMRILKKYYAVDYDRIISIGLGDGFNDLPLLQEVDRPVLIPKEDGSYDPRIDLSGLIRAKGIGPAGWNEAVLELIR